MAAYKMSFEAAVDIPDKISERLLKLASERQDQEREDLARKIANNIGTMLFGDKMKTGSGNSSVPATADQPARKTAYWSGGRTSTQPDLRPNPSRPRLQELARMKPTPIDPFSLHKIMSIDQSITGEKIFIKPGGPK